jgi:hypothetical protein
MEDRRAASKGEEALYAPRDSQRDTRRVRHFGMLRHRLARIALAVGCFVVGSCTAARCVCGQDAAAYYDGDLATQDALARSVARAVSSQREPLFYQTASERFDCQSAIAVYQMTLLGLGQIVLQHPEKRDAYLPAMRRAAELMLRPETMSYASHVYGHDGLSAMRPGEGHAYLGYVNLGLGMLRMVDPQTPLAGVHDRLTAQLAERLQASPHGMIETYPDETWPPDVAAVAGSIGLHASATHTDRTAFFRAWAPRFAACALDAPNGPNRPNRSGSGYLVQRVTPSCRPLDEPRGSGTAIASYFLAFAYPELSRRLYAALGQGRIVTIGGFGGVREYASPQGGSGDLNAGPMLFGIAVGATGFAIGAARMNGDKGGFSALVRSASLVGVPARGSVSGDRVFAVGGVLGNALLLAMLTARAP